MSDTYAPNAANNPIAFTLPDDGDAKPVASVRVAMEGLADKSAHVNWPEQDATKRYPLASRQLTRVQDLAAPTLSGAGDGHLGFVKNLNGGWYDVGQGSSLIFTLQLPDGAVLNHVTLAIQGGGSHGGTQPATAPHFVLKKIAIATNVATELDQTSYIASSGADYDTFHHYDFFAGVDEAIDNTLNRYIVAITGEYGAGAQNGFQVHACSATFTTTAQDPGAS